MMNLILRMTKSLLSLLETDHETH